MLHNFICNFPVLTDYRKRITEERTTTREPTENHRTVGETSTDQGSVRMPHCTVAPAVPTLNERLRGRSEDELGTVLGKQSGDPGRGEESDRAARRHA